MIDMIEISGKSVTIATILVLIGIMLVSGFVLQDAFKEPKAIFKEGPLKKNKELQLLPNEEYKYAYYFNDSQLNITYQIVAGKNCTVIRFMESTPYSEICIDKWGLDPTGSNSTYADPTIMIFKPWMLAVEENWAWNTTLYIEFDGAITRVSDMNLRVMRTENYRGRKSFVVEISSDDGVNKEYQWIDAEKRILLKIKEEIYELELVSGLPFED